MAFRKIPNKRMLPVVLKSAGCSQQASPMRPDSGFKLQQTIEKLENLDFSFQKTKTPKPAQAIQNELQKLEKNLDLTEINSFGITLTNPQQFKIYSAFIESLCKAINSKNDKLSQMIQRGLKGCKKAFNGLYTEIHPVSPEKPCKTCDVPKKSQLTQTVIEEVVPDRPCSTPEYENLKQLPKAFQNIQLSRISEQLCEVYETLKALESEIPTETIITNIALPEAYKPLKSDDAKQVLLSEFKEIKENIETFIARKKLRALQINKEIQTDKEPKNATWVALEVMNEEKEIKLLRLGIKFEMLSAEHKKLEEGLVRSNNLCSEYQEKACKGECENNELRGKNTILTEKTQSLEKRVLELGAMLRKLIVLRGFQKNLNKVEDLKIGELEKVVIKDRKDQETKTKLLGKRQGEASILLNNNENKRKNEEMDFESDSEGNLKSFREKVLVESEKIRTDTSPRRMSTEKWTVEGIERGFVKNKEGKYVKGEIESTERGFIKNKEGKYVKSEIDRLGSLSIANHPPRNSIEKTEFGTSYEGVDMDNLDLDLQKFISENFNKPEDTEKLGITEKQLRKLIGKTTEINSPEPSVQKTSISTKPAKTPSDPKKNKTKNFTQPISTPSKPNNKLQNTIQSKNSTKTSTKSKNSTNPSNEAAFDSTHKYLSSSSSETETPERPEPSSQFRPRTNSTKPMPNILINSSVPSPKRSSLRPNPNTHSLKPSNPESGFSRSQNASLLSLLSNNASNIENPFSDKDSVYEGLSSSVLQIPGRKSLQVSHQLITANPRPLSRSSMYSYSKNLLDFSFVDETEGINETSELKEGLKNLEEQLKQSFSNEQNQIFQEIKRKEEELKVKNASFFSKGVQCTLCDPEDVMDQFDRMRMKEKYRILLENVFENPNDINLLGPKGRRELAHAVKGHSLSKCSGTCEHLKKAMRIVQKYRGKPYPLKLIKM